MADNQRPRRPSDVDEDPIGPQDPFWIQDLAPAEREQELRLNRPGFYLNPQLVHPGNPPDSREDIDRLEWEAGPSDLEELPTLLQHRSPDAILAEADPLEIFPADPEAQMVPAAGPSQATEGERPVLRHLHDHLLMRLDQLQSQSVPRHPGVNPEVRIPPYSSIRLLANRALLPDLHRQRRRSALRELARLRYVELVWRVWLLHGVVPPADLGEPTYQFRDDRAPALHLVTLHVLAVGGVLSPLPLLKLGALPSLREARFEPIAALLQRRGRPPLCVRWLRAISDPAATSGRASPSDTSESSPAMSS